jgi:geranylgeranyl diphosphate synthase, type II
MDLKEYLYGKIKFIEKALGRVLPARDIPEILSDGMRYSIFSGGKRIRPILLLASCKAVGGDERKALKAACAVELIHTYSLIHDDLPAMDNDDLRRGKPTLHKVVGEANAILAGDALLTLAFQILSEDKTLDLEKRILLISELGRASGASGMVGGQAADIEYEGKSADIKAVEYIHSHKTGSLITASCRMGGIAGDADRKSMNTLTKYGQNMGLAFQITDDILNITGDKTKTGKAIGSDIKKKKATYPAVLGIEKSRQKANECIETATKSISIFNNKGIVLKMIAESLLNRLS